MPLSNLSKTTTRSQKRLGRGLGSGKGKTAARGMKGQKARGKVAQGFIGGTLPLYKRLPMARGRGGRGGKNMRSRSLMIAVDLTRLSKLGSGTEVTLQSLIDHQLVDTQKGMKYGAKIVGKGPIDFALTVHLPTSSSAAAAIEKAGGKVVNG